MPRPVFYGRCMLKAGECGIKRAPRNETTSGGQRIDVAFLPFQQLLGIGYAVAVEQCLQVAMEMSVDGSVKLGRIGTQQLAQFDKVDLSVQVNPLLLQNV